MVTMHSPSKRFFVAVGNIINIMTVDLSYDGVSLVAQLIKNPPAMWETWVGKIPWRRERLPTPVFWLGEFHGMYILWGHKESDMTE